MSRIRICTFAALIGVWLLSACGAQRGAQPNPDGSINVEVTLNDFGIESSLTEFKTGVPYHFIVTNEGQVPHEFMLMPVSEHMGMSGMSSMEEWDKLALMMIPIEQLPVGATAEADYTFAGIPEGNIEMVCMTPGHFEAGMHTPITIK